MKRYAAIIFSLLAVVALVTAVAGSIQRGRAMQVRFNKRDFPDQNVQLITSAEPAFEGVAATYFRGNASRAKVASQPFSVFIKNSGSRTIAAYMIVWQLVKADGQTFTNRTSYAEPAILMGEKKPSDPR